MAFDALETPFGKVDRIIGGSGTYVAWSASYFTKNIRAVSIVGGDFPQEEMDALTNRGVDLEGVEVVKDGKSFFWSGRYHLDMNTRDTLVPAVQANVINQLKNRPKLIVMDTMNFWMEVAMEDLKKTIGMVDVLMVNDSEARQLSGEFSLVKAAAKIQAMGPKYLIIKKGEHGALLFHGKQVFFAPALPLEEVFDPTGAGDTFAGGFMGHIAKTRDISFENMKRAIIVGSAMASFCVEKFGPNRLKELTNEEIAARINEFVELVNFDIQLS
jgi:sugar/nucleoside kinase (ribokinase family)